MRKRLLVAALMALFMAGCASQSADLVKQNRSLADQLKQREGEIDALKKKNEALEQDRKEQGLRIAGLKDEKAGIKKEVDDISAEKQALEKQREELQQLVKNLSGIKVEQRPEGNFIVMENKILFPAGKADLGPKGKESLQKIAEYLKKYPKQMIRVDGHTDSDPIKHSAWLSNFQLAAMRAHAVLMGLKSLGVAEGRMFIVGYGPTKPVVSSEKTEKDKQANRRVEILMVPSRPALGEEILKSVGK